MTRSPGLPDPFHASARDAFLRAARILVPALAAPFLAVSTYSEIARGHSSPLMAVQAVTVVVLSGGAWMARRRPLLSGGMLFLLLVVGSTTLAIMYGPLAGNGALMIAACLLAIVIFGWRIGVVASALAFAAYALVVAAMAAGLLPPPRPGVSDFARMSTWIRAGMGLALAVAVMTVLFAIVQRALERAIVQVTDERAKALAAAREREEAFQALAAAQRVEAIGFLAGGLAHDLRNVLTVVLAGAKEMRHADASPAVREIASDLEHAARGGVESARRLLALARDHGEGDCQPSAVLAGLGRMLGPALPDDIRLEVEAGETAPVAVPEGALSQAVLNLAVNARDAMPDGGRLALRSRVERSPVRVIVEVEDTGHGMDADTLSRAFDPLFTTKPPGLGSGLGLSMVKRTAEEAGGTVELESTPGRGTRVRLVLPPAEARGPSHAPVAGGGPAALGGEESGDRTAREEVPPRAR